MAHGLPLDSLNRCYDALLALCDRLELVADSLPDHVRPGDCAFLAHEVVEVLARTHDEEEQALLPLLSASPRPEVRQMAERLRREHRIDSNAVFEVQAALLELAAGRPHQEPEALGYLLRAFFETVRRHVRAEQDLLVLLAGQMPPDGSRP